MNPSTMLRTSNLTARMNRGADLLDKVNPNWYLSVNIQNFEIKACDRCVLGQVYGGYVAGLHTVFEHERVECCVGCAAFDYGFDVIGERFEEMNALWVQAIKTRQSQAAHVLVA